jgi:hypothetical protein
LDCQLPPCCDSRAATARENVMGIRKNANFLSSAEREDFARA